MEAVRHNGMALQWAATKLKADEEVVLSAINQAKWLGLTVGHHQADIGIRRAES